MIYSIAIAGFSMGIIGSLHCVGMCGPIALSLSGIQNSNVNRSLNILSYNGGRAMSYSSMGLILGLLGNNLALAGYQQLLSVIAGILILLIFFLNHFLKNQFSILKHWNTKIQILLSDTLRKPKTNWYHFEVGLINAWLPCGLVYLALASSLALANAWHGALFMFMFGAGTIPVMAGIMYAGNYISTSWRSKMTKLIPVFIVVTACLLILRGMNLGIPFISPEIDPVSQCVKHCCHR